MVPPTDKRRRHARPVLILCLLAVLTAVVLALQLNRPTGLTPSRTVEIRTGMTAHAIGRLLQSEDVIRSARLFTVLVRLQDLAHQLKAGTYELDGTYSTNQIIHTLLRAPVRTRRVTIPEGLNRHAVAGLLQRQGLADSSRFVQLTADPEFIHQLGLDRPDLEGFLFPETYFLDEHPTEESIIRRMVAQFHQVFDDALHARLEHTGLDLIEAVILASIVEGEAAVPEERGIIASVFLRRLKLNWRLQSCATVEYALGERRTHLTNVDLQVDSPYNTYRHHGLPPGPIGNPGKAALMAVLYPANTDYLYFVARGDGTHIFSRTHQEHQRARHAVRAGG